jgi:hypothetical protein
VVVVADLDGQELGWSELGIQHSVGTSCATICLATRVLWPHKRVSNNLSCTKTPVVGNALSSNTTWDAIGAHSLSLNCQGLYDRLCTPLSTRYPQRYPEPRPHLPHEPEHQWEGTRARDMLSKSRARMYDSIAFRECALHGGEGGEEGEAYWPERSAASIESTHGDSTCGETRGTNTLTSFDAERRALAMTLRVDAPLLRVASCFGGLMLYKWRSIKGLRYSDVNITARMDDCEHVFLHRRMALRGRGRIYLAPSLTYFHGQ